MPEHDAHVEAPIEKSAPEQRKPWTTPEVDSVVIRDTEGGAGPNPEAMGGLFS
jgi:hypothetical protein